ncbi:MAG: hypothetical protein KME16_04010 [Scytolyngbya sp. HA4215-MV1]|jgi:hypothetical protein|nr:hypothetical protein [Scytolyngbya sp. HA4215-MV1]
MQPITEQVESLLIQAEQAHGQYEQTILNGVYDQDWSTWYANYVIEQGIEEILNRPFAGERLSQFLSQNYKQYKAEQSQKTWAAYTAQKLVEASA